MNKTITVEDELKKLSRRIEEVSKTVELGYRDRDIFEDILSRLGTIEQALHLNLAHQTEVAKDMTANVKKIEFAVEDKVAEVKDIVNNKEILMVRLGVFEKIKKLLRKEKKK